jgi:hypothetical protein
MDLGDDTVEDEYDIDLKQALCITKKLNNNFFIGDAANDDNKIDDIDPLFCFGAEVLTSLLQEHTLSFLLSYQTIRN